MASKAITEPVATEIANAIMELSKSIRYLGDCISAPGDFPLARSIEEPLRAIANALEDLRPTE
jgi:hypothetical protein